MTAGQFAGVPSGGSERKRPFPVVTLLHVRWHKPYPDNLLLMMSPTPKLSNLKETLDPPNGCESYCNTIEYDSLLVLVPSLYSCSCLRLRGRLRRCHPCKHPMLHGFSSARRYCFPGPSVLVLRLRLSPPSVFGYGPKLG